MGIGDTRYLTIGQAAFQIGVHPETVRKFIRQGRIAAIRDKLHQGSPLLIEQKELTRFVDSTQTVAK